MAGKRYRTLKEIPGLPVGSISGESDGVRNQICFNMGYMRFDYPERYPDWFEEYEELPELADILKNIQTFIINSNKTVTLFHSDAKYPNSGITICSYSSFLHYLLEQVADYLNEGWKPDWNAFNSCKHIIYYSNTYEKWMIGAHSSINCPTNIYFKSLELAEKAIKIIGESTLNKLAFIS